MPRPKHVINAKDIKSDIQKKNLLQQLQTLRDSMRQKMDEPISDDYVEQVRAISNINPNNNEYAGLTDDQIKDRIRQSQQAQYTKMANAFQMFRTFNNTINQLAGSADVDIAALTANAQNTLNNLNEILNEPAFEVDTSVLFPVMQTLNAAKNQFKALPALARGGKLQVPGIPQVPKGNNKAAVVNNRGGVMHIVVPKYPDKMPNPESPNNAKTNIVPANLNGNLFDQVPSPNDIAQGDIGDCYLHSTMMGLAEADPDFIQNSIKDNGNNTVTVRFFGKQNANSQPIPVYVTIPKQIVRDQNDSFFNRSYTEVGSQGKAWTRMFEYAYAYSGLGTHPKGIIKTQDQIDTITQGKTVKEVLKSMEGGSLDDASRDLIGKKNNFCKVAIENPKKDLKDILATDSIVICGLKDQQLAAQYQLEAGHMYQIADVADNGDVTIRNPHNNNEPHGNTFTMPSADFKKCFAKNVEYKMLHTPEQLEGLNVNDVKGNYRQIISDLTKKLNAQDTLFHRWFLNSDKFNDLKDSLNALNATLSSDSSDINDIREQMDDLSKKALAYAEHTKTKSKDGPRRDIRMAITSVINKLAPTFNDLSKRPEEPFRNAVKAVAADQIAKGYKATMQKNYSAKKFVDTGFIDTFLQGKDAVDFVLGNSSKALMKEANETLRIVAPDLKNQQAEQKAAEAEVNVKNDNVKENNKKPEEIEEIAPENDIYFGYN